MHDALMVEPTETESRLLWRSLEPSASFMNGYQDPEQLHTAPHKYAGTRLEEVWQPAIRCSASSFGRIRHLYYTISGFRPYYNWLWSRCPMESCRRTAA